MLGRAKDHAKWQSVIAPAYRMNLDITFDKKKEKELKQFIEKLPKDLVKVKKDKLELNDEKNLPVLESYMHSENIDFISIKRDPTSYTFKFETDGSLTAKDAIIESANILEGKYEEFAKQLKNLK